MNTKVYVGNLPFDVTEDELNDCFSAHGSVKEINMVMDRETGRPRGFAFVEMDDVSSMEKVINELDGQDFNGRAMKVNEARPRENRSFSRDGGDRRGGDNDRRGGGKGNRRSDRW